MALCLGWAEKMFNSSFVILPCRMDGQVIVLRAQCVHAAHAKAEILTQEYLSPFWWHGEAAKPT